MPGVSLVDLPVFRTRPAVLYSIPNSPDCKAAREFLLKSGARFEEVDVSRSAAGLEEMMKLAPGSRPPVLKTKAGAVAGFDEKKFSAVLSSSSL